MNFENTKNNLEKRGFRVTIFKTAEEAAGYLEEQIKQTTVGIGGSVTVTEMGLFDRLNQNNEVWWHSHPDQLAEYGEPELRRRAMSTEVYICSVNGLSETGQIINIDGAGNRIASTAFGHDRLYLIVGKNKIEETFEKAMWRARNIASPKNAQRLGVKTPCAAKGDKCYDCNSPQRICRGFLTMERPMFGQEAEVILIDENLGY